MPWFYNDAAKKNSFLAAIFKKSKQLNVICLRSPVALPTKLNCLAISI